MPTIDQSAPDWARRFADDLERELESQRAAVLGRPLALPVFDAAGLPAAARWKGCLIAIGNGDDGRRVPAFSDGTRWCRLTLAGDAG